MSWGVFSIGETEHDLTHLDPYTLKVSPTAEDAPTYKVLVKASHHTFTRKILPEDLQDRHFGDEGRDVRCFCEDRYRLSLQIPQIVSTDALNKAYFPHHRHAQAMRNYLLVDGVSGVSDPYVIVFNLEAARSVDADATMFIVSAHAKPNLPPKRQLDSIKFSTLVSKVVRGEAVTRPQKKR